MSVDTNLRYHFLDNFDKAMIKLDTDYKILSEPSFIRTKNNWEKVLVFEKGALLFVFNWHSSKSYESYNVYSSTCSKL